MPTERNLPKIVLIAAVVITVLMGLALFMVPPAIFPDPSWGFQVMRSMQMGGGFNMLVSVSQDDVSKNISEYLTWWSPGQYMVPYLFVKEMRLSMGHAAALTITLCGLTGIAGFYAFFRKICFTATVSAVSIGFIVCQQFYMVPYVFYNGGEVLVFAFSGWFLYGCASFTRPGIKLALFVLFSGWIGFFCKSAFMWVYASGLLYLWISLGKSEKKIWKWIINGIWLGVPAVVAVGAIMKFYLSKGTNPTSASEGIKLVWETFSFPIASPLLAGFSVDDLFHGLVFNTTGGMFSHQTSVIILVVLAALSLVLVFSLIRFVPNSSYNTFIVIFYVISILFFGYAFLRQSAISYEGRHFRVMGLLVIPGVIYLVSRWKFPFKLIFALIWIGITYFSVRFVVMGYRYNVLVSAHGNSGLSQGFIDQPSLDYILALDRQQTNALFLFVSADLGLEIIHNRIINVEPIDNVQTVDPESYIHAGHAGPVYMLLPASYVGAKAAIYIKNFPDYKSVTMRRLSKNYVLYTAR